ncbi:MAG: hypothetical protein SFV19_17220 [Rhodospirillaceae bacterium]|nr:hypothetical protein [Rhodospirillaceae bacterium]
MSGLPAATLSASERPFIVTVKVLLWVFWGAVLTIMVQLREVDPAMADDEGATIFLWIFGLVWIASTLTLAQYVVARGPLVVVGPEGLLDRRTFRRVIPWSEIATAEITGKGLKLTVKQPYRFRWLSGALLSALPFLKPLFAIGRYDVPLAGLTRAGDEVTAAVLERVAAR